MFGFLYTQASHLLFYHFRPRIFWWDKKFQSSWPEDHPRGCSCKSMHVTNLGLGCFLIFSRNWKPCAGVPPRFAPPQAGWGDWGSTRLKSPRRTGCTWMRELQSRSWWHFKHCFSSTFSSPMLILQNYKMLRIQIIDHHRPTPMCRFLHTISIEMSFSSYFPWHNLFSFQDRMTSCGLQRLDRGSCVHMQLWNCCGR